MDLSTIARFAAINAKISRGFDRLLRFPPPRAGTIQPYEPAQMFVEASRVGDVGGGKKPFAWAAGLDSAGKEYIGLDLDPDELKRAPAGTYSEVRVVDICDPPKDLEGRFDLILCRNTLEHVVNVAAAIEGLSLMSVPGGRCFLELPCRHAAFARLNMVLPNELKRRMMHAVFPHKSGDGFPAFYDQCLPSKIEQLANRSGFEKLAERRSYRSTYFGFFFPLYVVWRLVTICQYLLDPDY
jgi:2-polyprenyl-6-hydroxyphenyl methylase/3-demethylubiquinone-9 3-methyltransferase